MRKATGPPISSEPRPVKRSGYECTKPCGAFLQHSTIEILKNDTIFPLGHHEYCLLDVFRTSTVSPHNSIQPIFTIMKIAMLVDTFPCRSETFILNQVTGLLERGHEVHVYAERRDPSPDLLAELAPYDWRSFYFQEGAGRIPSNKLVRLMKGLTLLRPSRERGVLVKSLNMRKFGKMAASFELLYKSAALLKDAYDLVHCHFGPNGQIGAALKHIGAIKGKVVTTFYGYDVTSYPRQHGHGTYDFLFSHGDLVIAISEKMKRDLIVLGCSTEKIVLHHLGVDLKRFAYDADQGSREDRVRILTVGRFVEKKGLEYGIRAVAQVLKTFPQIEYHIVGDGELRGRMTHLIDELQVGDQVKLLGWKGPEEVARLMKDSDLFLVPSVTSKSGDQEGTPTVIIEALARGLPVVSTLHSGIPEMIQDGKTGFLVPERDVAALAEALDCLIRYPNARREMGKAGRAWAEKKYDIQQLNDSLVELYDQVLNSETDQARKISQVINWK